MSAQDQVAALTSRLEQATASLKQAQDRNAQLTEANQRLTQEKASAEVANTTAGDAQPPGIAANLQRDNARLNDEVKRATRELLSLNTPIARPAA